jgi:isoaspartyl peptidase/L-asparaginase-like protein (Ntn-hydrolase superfamily)
VAFPEFSGSFGRRAFLRAAVMTGFGVAAFTTAEARTSSRKHQTRARPLILSTWSFGKPANETALAVMRQGGGLLDAVEQGIGVPEADRKISSVGAGGAPNAEGVVQLDACIMLGPGHRAGSVAALEGITHPISVARRVMEKTPHVMLVGDGARRFAEEQGFTRADLLTDPQRRAWEEWRQARPATPRAVSPANHDTIALLILGTDGHLAGGCSTSGWAYKLPGRVGDSPIIGSGLYVDDAVGAAGATGLGENVMRYCGSFLVVECMRRGAAPEDACAEAIRRIARTDPKGMDLSIHFIALDKRGRFGAAGTQRGFEYAVTCPDFSELRPGLALTDRGGGPVGGNRR